MADAVTISSSKLNGRLWFTRMVGTERLGELFRYHVDFLSDDAELDLPTLLGTPMTVTLKLATGYTRHFNGIVAEAIQGGFETNDKVHYAAYSVVLVPKPWLLTCKEDCRIFTNMTVPAIIKAVLAEVGYADSKNSLTGEYPARDYCVQYRESYFNFISRLMQQEGIYYYFTHTENTHAMVLADSMGAHSNLPGFEKVRYFPASKHGLQQDAAITEWETIRDVHSLKVQLTDYDPVNPKASLLATRDIGGTSDYHAISGLDVFDYPGAHVLAKDGERRAQVRVEALNVQHLLHHGVTDACGMGTGGLFTLTGFPLSKYNQKYLVVGTSIELTQPGPVSGDGDVESFGCSFETIASDLQFRNLPTAARPQIVGLQTAVVTGSKTDEDIVVDKYGRVQVTFHWNKPDKKNAQSSCPVRVASPWAGKTWGAVNIPRVGQEVVVSFLEGDPDRPLIIGSVYNADNMPPYALPDNKTQSGIKSRSLSGVAAEANELRFEDKKGSEEWFLHAQKDMREEVENDHFVTIDHDETLQVKHDQTEKIDNDRKHTIGHDDTLDVSNNGTTSIGKVFKLSAGDEIQLVCGQASITLKQSGQIDIKGSTITVNGNQKVNIEGQTGVAVSGMEVDLKADMAANLKGTMVTVEGSGKTDVKGAMVNIQGSAMVKVGGGIVMLG